MTITDKWRLMMSSFADIKSAISEKGGTLPAGGYGEYGGYAWGVQSIYEPRPNTAQILYPDTSDMPEAERAQTLVAFCTDVKEEIRRAIVDGGVECGDEVPLSEYGDKIRQIDVLRITSGSDVTIGEYGTPATGQLTAEGGTPPYTWSIFKNMSDPLPSGLTFSADGTFTGTVKNVGLYSGRVFVVTDANGKTARKTISLFCEQRQLHFDVHGETRFKYDGQPHKLDVYCVEAENGELDGLDEVNFTVVYGAKRVTEVTEKAQYAANINVWGNYQVAKDQKELSISITN